MKLFPKLFDEGLRDKNRAEEHFDHDNKENRGNKITKKNCVPEGKEINSLPRLRSGKLREVDYVRWNG